MAHLIGREMLKVYQKGMDSVTIRRALMVASRNT